MSLKKLTLNKYDWAAIQAALVFYRDNTPIGRSGIRKACNRALRKLGSKSATDRWWKDAAAEHRAADEACGRAWVCSCGACRAGRASRAGSASRKSSP